MQDPGLCALQDLEPGRYKFKSQLCHVLWASYFTSLNFNLVFSSERWVTSSKLKEL